MKEAYIPFTQIGVIRPKEEGIIMVVGEERIQIASPTTDEIYKAV
jgi:hypothetical protein